MFRAFPLVLVLLPQVAVGAPNLLPRPESVTPLAGEWVVPGSIVLEVSGDSRAAARAAVGLCSDGSLVKRIRLVDGVRGEFSLRTAGTGLPARPSGSEAYALRITPSGIALAASDEAGARWGMLTLMQLLSQGRAIPACEIEDRPTLALRGVMIDMIRLKERDEVYFRMLEEMAAWKMNALFLHFTDGNGCSIELKSHPEVVTQNAMSQETLGKLIARGRELGVRVIPEVEAWGHAGWMTRPHRELSEGGHDSLCLSNEAVYTFLDEVIREVAALFPDPYLHVGCDEANYAKCDTCKARAEAEGEEKLIADHINRLNGIVRRYGKISVVWGDIILRSERMLSLLDHDIVVENWDYKETVRPDKLRLLHEQSRPALAGPALMWNGYRICPAINNYVNTRRFCEHAKVEGAQGVATTIWITQRCVPGTLGPGIAWAAAHSWNPGAMDMDEAAAGYLVHRFGLEPTPERIRRMASLADVGQSEGRLSPAFWWKREKLVHLATPEMLADMAGYAAKVRGLEAGFMRDLLSVRSNRNEFESLTLAAACGEHLLVRRKTGANTVQIIRKALGLIAEGKTVEAQAALRDAARQVRRMERDRGILFQRMQGMWDRDRYPTDGERSGRDGSSHNLMWWFGSTDTCGYALYVAERLEQIAEQVDAGALEEMVR